MAEMMKRLVAAYAVDEPWKIDHDGVKKCWEAEDLLASGIALYRRIVVLDADLQKKLIGKPAEMIEQYVTDIDELYRAWLEASERWRAKAERFVAQGYPVDGLDEFRAVVEEAAIIVGNAEFEAELRPIAEQLALVRPENPRPERYGD